MSDNKKRKVAVYMRFATEEQLRTHDEKMAEQKAKLIEIAKSCGLKFETNNDQEVDVCDH